MNTKGHVFYSNCCSFSFDVIIISETWLSDSFNDAELFSPVYNVLRGDRNFSLSGRSKAGGVLIALNSKIIYDVLDTSHIKSIVPVIDIVACKCFLGIQKVVICAIYIPPDITVNEFENFMDAIQLFLINEQVIFLGDFNVPNFMNSINCTKSASLHNLCELLNLTQYNNVRNLDQNILDLVFSNLSGRFLIERMNLPFVPEDRRYHPAIEIDFTFVFSPKLPKFPPSNNLRYNFRKANYEQLYFDFSEMDWSNLSHFDNVDEVVDMFYEMLYKTLDRSVPKFSNVISNFPIWFTPSIKSNLKTKNYYRKKWKSTQNNKYFIEFKRLRALVKLEIKEAYNSYLRSVESNIKNNPAELWKYVNMKKGATRIPGKLHDDQSEYNTPKEIVDAFANHFSNIFSDSSNFDISDTLGNNLSFVLSPVVEEDIVPLLASLQNKMTSGEDQLPSFLLKDCKFIFARPLSIIINLAIKNSVFPNRWKRTRITPVFKKNDKTFINNYRPISILNNFSKVMEMLIYNSIYTNIRSRISPEQHGFIKNRSTVTNLACFTQFVSESFDIRGQVDVIYTDFSRAFDSIDHGLLLHKISAFGAAPGLVKLLHSYLTNRICYVFYNGYSSFNFTATSGVPQGSNLGPLLFIIFIDELIKQFSCPVLAYADDLKIFNNISNLNDVENLQTDINTMIEWCNENKISLNINKCCVVSYTNRINNICNSYYMDTEILARKSTVKDLGVTFSCDMKFTDHVNNVCLSASKTLGFLIRISKSFTDITVLKTLYFAYVISKLEYAILVWFPFYTFQVFALDRVHRRFLKYLSYKIDYAYPDRGIDQNLLLVRHNMQALSCRRELSIVRFLWMLLHNKVDAPFLLSRIPIHVPQFTSRHTRTFYLSSHNTDFLRRSPVHIMCRFADIHLPDIFL